MSIQETAAYHAQMNLESQPMTTTVRYWICKKEEMIQRIPEVDLFEAQRIHYASTMIRVYEKYLSDLANENLLQSNFSDII